MPSKWNVQHKQRKEASKRKEAAKYVDGEGWTRAGLGRLMERFELKRLPA